MTQVFSTSPAGYALIKRFEGCEKRLPDDRLTAYKIGADPWTIGWGQTGHMRDGRKVEQGLIITQAEADDQLELFVRGVVDPLVRKHFNCRTQFEHDACASWVYNVRHDRLERGEYSLPALVNLAQRDPDAILTKWLQYVATPGFENGLYRRRLAEILMFLGLPWNVPAVWGYISTATYKKAGVKQPTDPWFILDVARAVEPVPIIPQRPKPTEDEITADANEAQLRKLKEKAAQSIPSQPVKAQPVETPNLDPVAPPKPMEDSKTHRGLSKAESGKETAIVGGVLTGLGAALPNIQAITTYLSQFDSRTILTALSVVGIGVLATGVWRWWAGRMIAHEGRLEATQPKI